MLSLNCLNAEEGATVAKRYLLKNAAELIQDRYFENTLASKLKSKGMLLWRRDFAFVSTENERLWIYSELGKIAFDQGRPPETSPVGTDDPDVLSSSSRTDLRLLPEMIKTHRILQSGLDHNSKFSLGPHKIISTPNQLEVAWNTTPTFPKNGLWIFSIVFFFFKKRGKWCGRIVCILSIMF